MLREADAEADTVALPLRLDELLPPETLGEWLLTALPVVLADTDVTGDVIPEIVTLPVLAEREVWEESVVVTGADEVLGFPVRTEVVEGLAEALGLLISIRLSPTAPPLP